MTFGSWVADPFAPCAKEWEFQTPIPWDFDFESEPSTPRYFSRNRFPVPVPAFRRLRLRFERHD